MELMILGFSLHFKISLFVLQLMFESALVMIFVCFVLDAISSDLT